MWCGPGAQAGLSCVSSMHLLKPCSLTVSETLYYAAHLRLPREWPDIRRAARVDDVIARLHLRHVSETPIGGPSKRGISGGERKRVCIALELLTHPDLALMDEPTCVWVSSARHEAADAASSGTGCDDCTAASEDAARTYAHLRASPALRAAYRAPALGPPHVELRPGHGSLQPRAAHLQRRPGRCFR